MENEKLTWVTKPKGKRFYVVRWVDPVTNLVRQRSTGQARRRDAQTVADEVAVEVFAGTADKDISWRNFCERYERERLSTRSPKTLAKWRTAAALLKKHLKPQQPRELSANRLSQLIGDLTAAGMKPETLDSHLRHIKAALAFAVQIGQLPAVPLIQTPKPRRRKHMKGRPISGEEFERLLEAVRSSPALIPPEHAASWLYLLRGLWTSGLRLSEALQLGWDEQYPIQVQKPDSLRPMLLIPAEHEKGGRDRIYPVTPEFAELLRETPHPQRVGAVFTPSCVKGPLATMPTVSAKICALGRAANIVVHRNEDSERVKCASAHDLRRSFGARWAARVMPAVLQQLMRHESIETTMRYYVGQNAEQFAEVVWGTVTNDRDPVRDPRRKRQQNG